MSRAGSVIDRVADLGDQVGEAEVELGGGAGLDDQAEAGARCSRAGR